MPATEFKTAPNDRGRIFPASTVEMPVRVTPHGKGLVPRVGLIWKITTTGFSHKKIMHLLFSPLLGNIYYIGGGSVGLLLVIVVVVMLLR